MHFSKILLLFICCVFSSVAQQTKINGISFVASANRITDENIKPIVNVNASHVALMPFGFIKHLTHPNIQFNSNRQWFGETKEGIYQYAKVCKDQNLKIMLKPQLWVWQGEYTGFINMQTEESWSILEQSYKNFILFYAKIATEIDASIFCIGTELEQFVQQRPIFFSKLITEIRLIYKGKITYAANWDEFKRVPFWHQLDFIGIDAYFPVTEKQAPSVVEFEQGWQSHKLAIQNVQQRYQKPVLFTEYGYRSVNFAGKEPWLSNKVKGSINLQNQVNGLQAIYNVFWNEPWFAGGFIWKWFVNHDKVGGQKNNRFTPQNKPAEKLLSKLYSE